MLRFSKFDFIDLDLFILLMHLATYIKSSTCYPHLQFLLYFAFEVSDLCIALALTMLATIAGF